MKHTNNFLLVSLLVLSIISTAAIINPAVVPPVQAGGAPGDSEMLTNCVGLIPKTLSCVGEMQPFEAIVYDLNLNGVYDAGETIIVGPSVSLGQALTDEPNVRYRDANNNLVWTSATPEPIFYDQDGNVLTTNDRVFLIGAPTAAGTLIRDDPAIKFADTSGDGRLNGVVGITARLEKVGGTNIDGTAEDVDAIQVVYTYDPGVLSVMRRTYTPVGSTLPDGTYKNLVRLHCQNSGTGASPLDAINVDEAGGKVSSSHLCSQGPPRDPEVGIGCDPAVVFCPGDNGAKLQNVDIINMQFMVIAHGAFTIKQVVDAPGTPGTKISDIDVDQTRLIPLRLSDGLFDNRKPVSKVAPTAVITAPTKANIKEKVIFDGSASHDNNVPAQDLTYSWMVDGAVVPGSTMSTLSYTFFTTGLHSVTLTVCNTSMLCDSASHTIQINPVKAAPTAVILGPGDAFVKTKVTFDGGQSRDNSNPVQEIISYEWTINPPAGWAINPQPVASMLSVTFFTPGVYTVTLTVCNQSGLCGSTDHLITINAIKADPTAVINGPDKAFVKEKIGFDSFGSHDNSNPTQSLTYEWTVTGPGPVDVNTQPGEPIFSATFFTPGVYTIRLTVCNTSTLCGTATHTIQINPVKAFPTAAVTGPTKAFIKADVTFDASASRDNSNPIQSLSYSWSVDGGASVAGGPMFTTAFFTTGPHTVTVTVCNTSMLCSSASHTIQINPVKEFPTAAVTGPTKAFIKADVTFDASASRDNSNPLQSLSYSWSVDGGASVAGGSSFTTAFFTTGLHTVTVTVCNTSMLCSSASHTIQINPVKRDPTAVLTGPDKAFVKEKVVFDGSGSRDNSNPTQSLSYSWMVDGAVVPGATMSSLSYTFFTTGQHTVTLTVCNTSTLCGTATHTIEINPVKAFPTAVVTGPSKADIKADVTFDASASRDNSNPLQTLSYSWSVDGGVPVAGGAMFTTAFFTTGLHTVTVTVCNTSGLCADASTSITINAVKAFPTAVITGPIKADVKQKVGFDAFGSRDNSNPLQSLTYSWTVTGPGPVDVNTQPGEPVFSATFFTPGVYTITLTVCNTSGLCADDVHDITINAVKAFPTAAVTGPTKAFIKADVTFDASASRDNSNPLQSLDYSWSVDGGASVAGGPMFTTAFFTTGLHTVTVTVCNTSMLCSSASHTIEINPVKNPPTASLTGPDKVFIGEKAIYDGSGSRDNSNPVQDLTYSWTVDAVPRSETTSSISVTFTSTGLHTVSLTVCNESMMCDTTSITVTANPVKRDPTAVINAPDKEFVDTKVVYDGGKSFDNSGPVQSIISYEWTDATGVPLGSGPILSQTYSSPGMYTVVLTVCNESMFCDTASHTITINANKVNPTAVINGPDKAFVKQKVGFDAFGSHDNSRPLQGLTYSWTVVGPGPVDVNTQPGEPVFSATFFTPGLYTITLTVCNTSTLCDDTSHIITINPIKRDPTAVLSCQDATGKIDCPTKVDVKTKITFDGSQSSDNSNPTQRIVTYEFTVSTGGTIVGGQSSTSPKFSFTPLDTGTYTVCLVVFNESGLRSTADCVSFNVNAVKANPTAVINGPAKVTEGSTVVYDGKKSFDNSNPQQGIFSYAWEFNGAPAGNAGQVTVTFGPAGDYTLTLTVCNDSGLCNTVDKTIRANPPKLPVVITGFSVCTVIGDPTCTNPPLKATGQRDIFITETQNFTATWTGGTGPFTCTFTFGDSSSATVTTSGQSCTASHVYTATGTFTVSVRVVGQNPGDDQSTSFTVQLNPEPRFFHGKLSWKHHLVSPALQSFSGKATNPSTKTVLVRIDLVVDMPNGMQDFCKDEATPDNCSPRSFTLGPGGSNTNMAFTYTPGDGLGKYCFDATLSYGIDQNGNGLLEQTEVLGTDNVKSGCFNYV